MTASVFLFNRELRFVDTWNIITNNLNIRKIIGRFFQNGQSYLRPEQVHRFTVNLEMMLASGINLVRALDALAESEEEEFQSVCTRLSLDVAGGWSFSKALSRNPRSFSPSYCRIIQSGEMTGGLGVCLKRLARSHQKQTRLKQVLKKAITYPLVLLIASSLMVGLVLYLVFPMILKFTAQAGVDPPAITQFVTKVASPSALGVLVVTSLLLFGLLKLAMMNRSRAVIIRTFFESYAPPGRFFALSQSLVSLRQFALMIESGTDVVRALRVSGHIGERSVLVQRAFRDMERRVKDGELLSEGFSAHRVFPATLVALVEIAEETGKLHTFIEYYCDFMEEHLQTKIASLSSAFEPILMGVMGLVVGVVLLAAFLPVYQLVTI